MGCGGSKQGVVPVHDAGRGRGTDDDAVAAAAEWKVSGGKTFRQQPSKRQVDRNDNKSFFDKSRSAKGFSANGEKSRRVQAFNSRKPARMDVVASDESPKKPYSPAGGKSRFAKSLAAVTDAMFGPPPEWILRQTAPIKSQYQFMGVVGRGQFGQVYCIRHVRQNAKFACKTLGKRKLLSQLDADDIKREIEVMYHLAGNKLVVGLHQVYEDSRNVHLVMDLCQGDLYELLREVKFLSEEQAAPLMLLAIQAVSYCHSMGVVHRDIKPENFLLVNRDSLDRIKLTDFGLSTFYQEGQVFNELLGSPYYIAPEVIRQKYGKEADVWSCGVMLYIMLCGEAPFFGEGDEGIFKSIMKAKLDFSFEPWPRLSKDVKMLLRRMLVKDPRERATLEEVMAHPWFARFAGKTAGDTSGTSAQGSSGCGGEAGKQLASRTTALSALPLENILFSRVKRYSVASRTKKATLRYIVASLPDEVTAGLYNLFQDFDSDANQVLDVREVQSGFGRRGVVLLDDEASALVDSADLDGDGVLNLVEWLGATIYIPEEQVDLLVADAFAFIDNNRDGYLSPAELLAYLGAGQEELTQLILAEADTDHDGRLSGSEFLAAYHKTVECSRKKVTEQSAVTAVGGAGGVRTESGDVDDDGFGSARRSVVQMTSVTSLKSIAADDVARCASLVS